MESHGATGSAERFYWAVNDAYHAAEAKGYDTIHADMYAGLGPIWRRLLTQISSHEINALDVGAGTGLMGEMLVRFCPGKIVRLTALDPSAAMLEEHRKKSVRWPFPTDYVLGDIGSLPADAGYHLVIVNSVLHHIVELESFCRRIQEIVVPGGFIATAQDPRDEAGSDHILKERSAFARKRWSRKLRKSDIFGRIFRKSHMVCASLIGRPYIAPLARAVNATLLCKGIIARPMTLASIHSVTDFHVPGEGGWGQGIRVAQLSTWFDALSLVETFTYQFHGIEWTSLTPKEQQLELELLSGGDAHGSLFATLWSKQPKQ